MPTPQDKLLTAGEAGEMLQVSAETIRRWSRKGRIAHITLPSGARRFRRSDVEAILTPVTPVKPEPVVVLTEAAS